MMDTEQSCLLLRAGGHFVAVHAKDLQQEVHAPEGQRGQHEEDIAKDEHQGWCSRR